MKILYFSQYYPPEPGASAIRARHMARALVEAGHEVTMIAEVPNHPHGVVQEGYGGKLWDRRMIDGVEVFYVWVYTSQLKNFRTRLAFYISYMLVGALAGLLAARGKFDLVFATSPPLFVGAAGWAVSALRRAPFVFEAIDLWPEAAVAVGELRNPRIIGLATRLEEFCYARAKKIVVTAQEMVDRLTERGMPREKLVLVRNGAKTGLFEPNAGARRRVRAELGFEGKFVVIFAGLHGLAYDLQGLMETANLLKAEPDIQFLLIGDGVGKAGAQKRAEDLSLRNVSFLRFQPYEKIPDYFNAADALVVPMKEPHIIGTLPVKIYDAMACGLPVIAAATGEVQRVIEESGGGIVVEPENIFQLKNAILNLHNNKEYCITLGREARRVVESKYSLDAQGQKFVSELTSAV